MLNQIYYPVRGEINFLAKMVHQQQGPQYYVIVPNPAHADQYQPIFTVNYPPIFTAGEYCFITLMHEGNLQIRIHRNREGASTHLSLLDDLDMPNSVLYAGVVCFDENFVVQSWSNRSGSFQPDAAHAFQARFPMDKFEDQNSPTASMVNTGTFTMPVSPPSPAFLMPVSPPSPAFLPGGASPIASMVNTGTFTMPVSPPSPAFLMPVSPPSPAFLPSGASPIMPRFSRPPPESSS